MFPNKGKLVLDKHVLHGVHMCNIYNYNQRLCTVNIKVMNMQYLFYVDVRNTTFSLLFFSLAYIQRTEVNYISKDRKCMKKY